MQLAALPSLPSLSLPPSLPPSFARSLPSLPCPALPCPVLPCPALPCPPLPSVPLPSAPLRSPPLPRQFPHCPVPAGTPPYRVQPSLLRLWGTPCTGALTRPPHSAWTAWRCCVGCTSTVMGGTTTHTEQGCGYSPVLARTARRRGAVGSGGALGGYSRVLLRYCSGTGVHGCCGRPRGRACRALCAGAYVSGAAGSNECPAGSARIETEAACRTVAAAAGKFEGTTFVWTASSFPRGCYYYTDYNIAYFNTDAVGTGNSGAQLLCAAVSTTGAPPPHRCAHSCAPVCAAVLRGCNIIRVLLGTYMVLKGTPTVLRTPPSTRDSLVFLWHCLWDALGSARRCGAHQNMVRVVRQCRVL
jgi:hypothetical protein